jgi:hypothetical protein
VSRVHATSDGTRPSRRRFDHDAAFAFWHNAGGQRRTWEDVASQFGVSMNGVWKAACRDGWHERAAELEEQARKAVDKRAVKSIEARIRDDLALIDATKIAYARGLQDGKVTVSASEMAQLIRVEQLLTGGPSERIAGETESHRRSLAEIESELASLDPAEVDAMLDADAIVADRLALPPAPDTAMSEPVAAGDSEPESEPTPPAPALTAGSSASPDESAVVEAEVVDEDEPTRPDGMTLSEWEEHRSRVDAWGFDERGRGPLARAVGLRGVQESSGGRGLWGDQGDGLAGQIGR